MRGCDFEPPQDQASGEGAQGGLQPIAVAAKATQTEHRKEPDHFARCLELSSTPVEGRARAGSGQRHHPTAPLRLQSLTIDRFQLAATGQCHHHAQR